MSLSNQNAREQVTLAALPTDVSFPYILGNTDVKVVRTRGGVDTDATLSTHYNVINAGVQAGCTVRILNNAFWLVGDVVTIFRNGQIVQPTTLPASGNLPSATLERDEDRGCMLQQQQNLAVKRSIRVPVTNGEMPELTLADRAGKMLSFDTNGNPETTIDYQDIVDASNDAEAAAIAAAASASAANSSASTANSAAAAANLYANNSNASAVASAASAVSAAASAAAAAAIVLSNYKGTWNASTNTPTLVDGVGTVGDYYSVQVGGTRNLGSGSITYAVGDWVAYNGTIWQKRIESEWVNALSLSNITGAGDTPVSIASGIRDSSLRVTATAGTAPYVATISLTATNAVAGARIALRVTMPGSANPRIEIRNLTSTGTHLAMVDNTPWVSIWEGTFRFDGTNWFFEQSCIVQHTSQGYMAKDETRTANIADFINDYAVGQELNALPKAPFIPAQFSNTDRFTETGQYISGSNLAVNFNSARYRMLARGAGSYNVDFAAIGSNTGIGEIPVDTEFRYYCSSNGFETITFRDSGGSTITTVPANSSNYIVYLRASVAPNTWVVTQLVAVNTARTSTLLTHLGTIPSVAGGGFPDNQYSRAQVRTEGWRIRFRYDGTQFWFRVKANSANITLFADGERIINFSTGSDGNMERYRMAFADAKIREIEVCGLGMFFAGIEVEEAGKAIALTKRPNPGIRIGVIGDSIQEPRSIAGESPGEYVAHMMGWEAWVNPVGGTGYVNNNGTPGLEFIGRVLTDVITPMNAYTGTKFFVVAGGINDPRSNPTQLATLRTAVDDFMDYVDSNLTGPVTKIALGPWWPRNVDPEIDPVSQIIKEEAAAHGWLYIPTTGWINGRMDAPVVQGNAQVYISDGTHLTPRGRRMYAARLTEALMTVLGRYAPMLQ